MSKNGSLFFSDPNKNQQSDEGSHDIDMPRDLMKYLNFATLPSQMIRDLAKTTRRYGTFYKYSKEDVLEFLAAPDRNEQQLRDASIYLYNASSYYHRLIDYFSKMPTLAYVLSPSNFDREAVTPEEVHDSYIKSAQILERMDVAFSFRAPLTVALREDVSYNYILESKDGFAFQKLDPNYCVLCSRTDGVYDCAFDFSYFNSRSDELPLFPKEFETKYNAYRTGGSALRYQQLDTKKTFVLKANYDITYPIPPFAGVFESIYDIIDYKALLLAKTEIDNYKVLYLKLPVTERGDLIVNWKNCRKFYNQLGENLPENIGLGMGPFDVDSFNFEKAASNSETDKVRAAEENFWSSAGVSSLNFNNTKASNNALLQSIKSDESIVWGLVAQIERWINRYLRQQSGGGKFHVMMPRISVYNEKERADQYLQAAQSGFPTKMLYGAAIGLDPNDIAALSYLENEVLDLPSELVPLQTSHTMSGSNEVGRPTNESKDEPLTDSGEESQEREG